MGAAYIAVSWSREGSELAWKSTDADRDAQKGTTPKFHFFHAHGILSRAKEFVGLPWKQGKPRNIGFATEIKQLLVILF